MTTTLRETIGSGAYTVSEAALYARITPQMMARWLFGNKKGEAVIRADYGGEKKLVSFLDFVQTLAIREIRLQHKVPLPKFRQAIKVAKERLDMPYPFARQHCTYLFGEDLVIDQPGQGYVQVSGRDRGQRLFHFVEMYLTDLTFDLNGLANAYRIFTADNKVPIMMKPKLRFGEPLLPSGYSALSIWESFQAEGDLDRTAEVNGIPKEEVEASYKFFNYLGKAAA